MRKGFKAWAENIIEWYLKIRFSKIQRASGLVVLTGVALMVMSFNEFIFNLFLEPIGFTRNGLVAPIFSVILITLGLFTLGLDRVASEKQIFVDEFDIELFQKFDNILSWENLNGFLDNIYNHRFYLEQIKRIHDAIALYKDPKNRFSNTPTQEGFEQLNNTLTETSVFCATYFHNVGSVNYFRLLPENRDSNDERKREVYTKRSVELTTISETLEKSYKEFIRVARTNNIIRTK